MHVITISECRFTIKGAPIIAEGDGNYVAGSFPETQCLSMASLSRFDSKQDAQDPKGFLRAGSTRIKRARSVASARIKPARSVASRACKAPRTSPAPSPEEDTFHRSVSENHEDDKESLEPPSSASFVAKSANVKDAIYWKCTTQHILRKTF